VAVPLAAHFFATLVALAPLHRPSALSNEVVMA
jgi:hypothetical protein